MKAEEARKQRYSSTAEQVGFRNTFNLLVGDYYQNIQSKISSICKYTDSLVVPLYDLCNREDCVKHLVWELKEDGYKVDYDENCWNNISWYTLYITWSE